jgi:hypothetical protein
VDPVVDERADRLLWDWSEALHQLGKQIIDAERGACYGTGQAEIRTYQRGGDPTPSRLVLDAPAPYVRDEDAKRLRRLREAALHRLGYDLAWLERELRPPEPQ